MMANIRAQSEHRTSRYSPFSFLRGRDSDVAEIFRATLDGSGTNTSRRSHVHARLWVTYLEWDSRYFGCSTYRLEFSEWDEGVPDPAECVAQALAELQLELAARHGRYYLFAEVPSEDVVVMQALGLARLRLIETRLTYVRENLSELKGKTHHAVRPATESDIPDLRVTAMRARNNYDRFHADTFFSEEVADTFVAEYVEQCVRGLTDIVLVPDENTQSPDAFICGALSIAAPEGIRAGRLVLTAVANTRKGWYRHLNEALLAWMQANGMSYCLNTTQSTNRAVIHVCEQLGYKYGRATHVFAGYQK